MGIYKGVEKIYVVRFIRFFFQRFFNVDHPEKQENQNGRDYSRREKVNRVIDWERDSKNSEYKFYAEKQQRRNK